MSDLPNRDNMLVQTSLERTPAWAVLVAYQRGDLKSRDEMNIEAAAAVMQGDDIDVSSWEQWAETLLDAAWGEVADE